MDPLATETAEFWKPFGEFNDVDPTKIQTEVFRLPTTCFAEERGSLVSSSRVLQWHWQGRRPSGEARSDLEIMSGIFLRMKKMYQKDGGKFPDPILNLTWPYAKPFSPTPEELAMEYNGKALKPSSPIQRMRPRCSKKGEQLAGFAQLRDDGSTQAAAGSSPVAGPQAGNQMGRRDNSDPTGIGKTLNWAWAWPANRRVLYNRASCDPKGKPFDPTRKLVSLERQQLERRGRARLQAGRTAGKRHGAVHHAGRRRGALLLARRHGNEGPFPEHYEPFETPLGYNPLHPSNPRPPAIRPAACSPDDRAKFGKAAEFPHVATSYRLTEHFHYWTKHARLNAIIQPEQFVEIGEELAQGDRRGARATVKVSSKRGAHHGVAVVTKRIKALMIEGKKPTRSGCRSTWGFKGLAKPGYLINTSRLRGRRQFADTGIQVLPGQGRKSMTARGE
jgi:formate dehydrogenase major subunit